MLLTTIDTWFALTRTSTCNLLLGTVLQNIECTTWHWNC